MIEMYKLALQGDYNENYMTSVCVQYMYIPCLKSIHIFVQTSYKDAFFVNWPRTKTGQCIAVSRLLSKDTITYKKCLKRGYKES